MVSAVVDEPPGKSSQIDDVDEKVGTTIEQPTTEAITVMSVDLPPTSPGMKHLSPARSFRPFQAKRIDSQNTASTAETSQGSFDSFVLKGSGDSFLSHAEPDSPAAYFAQSYNKIVMEKLESKLSITTSPPPLPLSGVSPKQGREGAKQTQSDGGDRPPTGLSAKNGEEPISEQSGPVAFFDDSYRKIEKRRSDSSVNGSGEEPVIEPSSPAAFFDDSYRKIEKRRSDSSVNGSGEEPIMEPSGSAAFFDDSYRKIEKRRSESSVNGNGNGGEPIMEPSGPAAFFDDSYRKIEKRRSDISVNGEEPLVKPSGAAAFFDDSFQKMQSNRSVSSLNDDAPPVAASSEPSYQKMGHRRIASEGKPFGAIKESYQKYAKLAKVNSVGASVGAVDGDGKEEAVISPSSATSFKESYQKYTKLAPVSHGDSGIAKQEIAVEPFEVEVRPQTEPISAGAGATFFSDTFDKLMQETKNGNSEGESTALLLPASPRQFQHGVSDSKLVTEGGIPTFPQKLVSDSHLVVEKPSSSPTSNPYQQLKRFMRDGMGRVPEDRVGSMAETRLAIARQASTRAGIRAGKVGTDLISRKTMEELEAAADETFEKTPGGLVMSGLSDDESFGRADISCGENVNMSGHNIDMSGRVGAITPPRSRSGSRSPKADLPTSMKIPAMAVDEPSRGQPSEILFQPLQERTDGESAGESSSEMPSGRKAEKRGSLGAAELFEQFHASTMDAAQPAGLRPGAFSARGIPTGDSPQWSRDAAQQLQPPQRTQWASWGPGQQQQQRRRRSSFQNWIRRRSIRFSTRDLVLDGPLPEDVAVGVPAPAPSIDNCGINNERPARRRSSFFRGGESARRLIGLRLSRVAQRQQAPPENMSFNPVSLELEPTAEEGTSTTQPSTTAIVKKKKFRRTRKLFSRFGAWGQLGVNAFVKYT